MFINLGIESLLNSSAKLKKMSNNLEFLIKINKDPSVSRVANQRIRELMRVLNLYLDEVNSILGRHHSIEKRSFKHSIDYLLTRKEPWHVASLHEFQEKYAHLLVKKPLIIQKEDFENIAYKIGISSAFYRENIENKLLTEKEMHQKNYNHFRKKQEINLNIFENETKKLISDAIRDQPVNLEALKEKSVSYLERSANLSKLADATVKIYGPRWSSVAKASNEFIFSIQKMIYLMHSISLNQRGDFYLALVTNISNKAISFFDKYDSKYTICEDSLPRLNDLIEGPFELVSMGKTKKKLKELNKWIRLQADINDLKFKTCYLIYLRHTNSENISLDLIRKYIYNQHYNKTFSIEKSYS